MQIAQDAVFSQLDYYKMSQELEQCRRLFTYALKPGLTDESRNCISNINSGGLNYKNASDKIYSLVVAALKNALNRCIIKG